MFTLKDLEEDLRAMDLQKRPREYVITMSKATSDYVAAVISGNTAEAERLSAQFKREALERHNQHLPEFIAKYGEAVAAVVSQWERKDLRDVWLAYKKPDDPFEITLSEDEDNDDIVKLYFHKGVFSVWQGSMYCSYGHTMEDNLTLEQVKEKLESII